MSNERFWLSTWILTASFIAVMIISSQVYYYHKDNKYRADGYEKQPVCTQYQWEWKKVK